jgi:hypothetical protein
MIFRGDIYGELNEALNKLFELGDRRFVVLSFIAQPYLNQLYIAVRIMRIKTTILQRNVAALILF